MGEEAPISRVAERVVYESPFGRLHDDEVRGPGGVAGSYLRWEWASQGVLVVPVRPDGALGLCRAYRYPAGRWLWEFPRGAVEDGEDRLAAAARELSEESGLETADAHEIGSIWADSGLVGSRVYIIAARVAGTGGLRSAEPFEAIDELDWVQPDEMAARVASGQLRCGLSIAAAFMFVARNR